jgi:hypothetical protein
VVATLADLTHDPTVTGAGDAAVRALASHLEQSQAHLVGRALAPEDVVRCELLLAQDGLRT